MVRDEQRVCEESEGEAFEERLGLDRLQGAGLSQPVRVPRRRNHFVVGNEFGHSQGWPRNGANPGLEDETASRYPSIVHPVRFTAKPEGCGRYCLEGVPCIVPSSPAYREAVVPYSPGFAGRKPGVPWVGHRDSLQP